MDIRDLKSKIERNRLDDSFMIFLLEDETSRIIARQYIHKISENRDLDIKMIDSISDIPDESFIEDTNLYIVYTDKWDSNDTHKNCIVICKECELECVKIPSLSDWQLTDYLKSLVNLDEDVLKWLVTKHHGDKRNVPKFDRLLNDMQKIRSFDRNEHQKILEEMIDDCTFDDLSSKTVFDLTNGIIRNEKDDIISTLLVRDYIDCDPLPLITILYKNFKNMLVISTNKRATAQDLEMSDKQFYFTKKYNCSNYTVDQLVRALKIITNSEYMYKFGGLDIDSYDSNKDQLIDYLVVKLLEVKNEK